MIKHFYNRIADKYDTDWSGIYADIRKISLDQITRHFECKPIKNAIDIAIGTGSFFDDLSHHLFIQHRMGIDISEKMLKQAAKKISGDIKLICDDVLNIRKYVADHSQDLIVCQFLFSYLNSSEVLKTACRILKPGGVIALASSTKKDLQALHSGRFRITNILFNVEKYLKEADTPACHEDLLSKVAEYKLQVVRHTNYKKQVTFKSFDDVRSWAIDSGWAAQYFNSGFRMKTSVGRAIFAGLSIIMHPLYPIYAHNDISVILAQRPTNLRDAATREMCI